MSSIHNPSAAATQAEQEAATSTTKMVTPGQQQSHPSACKGWVQFTGTGTLTINDSYNVSSMTDHGTGDYTVTWDTDFSSANYAVVATCGQNATGSGAYFATAPSAGGAQAAGTVRLGTFILGGTSTDAPRCSVVAFGDRA